MKELLKVALCAGLLLGLVGCGKSDPEDVAVEIYEDISDGDVKALAKFFDSNGSKKLSEAEKVVLAEKIIEASGKTIKKHSGLDSVKATETKIVPRQAIVTLKADFKDDSSASLTIELVEINGEWKISQDLLDRVGHSQT
ncbi:hypothetical protein BKN38_05475 [Helicobacter sp. CLO-3]|uniref:DUF4878 domain-containing protein n=1 Tax=unclassified Helicobacter TaxID=2593540 RepID=UPI000804EA36|nr:MULTISPECIES: DUF4878 domain-containing protein [unclassified Helicobacter]OBV29308.1 hypothetical protein BA723_05985 [Helicobacter sp. CLO-3]OHU83338.1 hypothetical protein BKN38_05475 [Helicobacter sp. CLO-3]